MSVVVATTDLDARLQGSGTNEVFTFGHFESAIVHFHRALGAALES